MAKPISERTIFVVLAGVIALFLLINFNEQLGMIFLFIAILDYIIFYTDSFHSFHFESRVDNRFEAILWSVVSYGVFVAIALIAAAGLQPQTILAQGGALSSFLSALSAQIPALSTSVSVSVLAYGFLIPMIETRFMARMLEFFADQRGLSLTASDVLRNPRAWLLFNWISLGFMLFHLTAKIALGTVALVSTYIFGMITCVMIVYFKEIKQAAGLHIVNNTYGVSCKQVAEFAAKYCPGAS